MVPLPRVPLRAAREVVRARNHPPSSVCRISLFCELHKFGIALQYPSRSFFGRNQLDRAYDAHQTPVVQDSAREKNSRRRGLDVNSLIVHLVNLNEHTRERGKALIAVKPYFTPNPSNIDGLKAYFRKIITYSASANFPSSPQQVLHVNHSVAEAWSASKTRGRRGRYSPGVGT